MVDVREIKKLQAEIFRCEANVLDFENKITDLKSDIERVQLNIDQQIKRKEELTLKIKELSKEVAK